MSAQVLKLRPMRKRQPVQLPESFARVREIFGLGDHGPFTHLELHRIGLRSYVMAVAGRLRLNVSIGFQFANREKAQRWARAFAELHGLEPEPTTKPRRAKP